MSTSVIVSFLSVSVQPQYVFGLFLFKVSVSGSVCVYICCVCVWSCVVKGGDRGRGFSKVAEN